MPTVLIRDDSLVFRFPKVHRDATLTIAFHRTLRIPDDGKEHCLPPGLGHFPLRDVDQYPRRLPSKWAERGGVMLPMYQSEALWLSFDSGPYPMAIQISTGDINCLTGRRAPERTGGLTRTPQNYVVSPQQPWLDGYNVGGDQIRQFVAAPLNHAASVEKQITGSSKVGGMQIRVRPLTAKAWKKHKPKPFGRFAGDLMCSESSPEMGFAAGGCMRQEIYADPYRASEWSDVTASCDVWVCNSLLWRAITGETPPTQPPEPTQYKEYGLPWFDYFDDAKLIRGSKALAALKSYKGGKESVKFSPSLIIELRKQQRLRKQQIRLSGNV